MLIELDCVCAPACENGLVLSIRDVLVSYQADNFSDDECYVLAEELVADVKPKELKEASFLSSDSCQRGPVILVLDKVLKSIRPIDFLSANFD
jgi:hypothetical protein